MLYKLFRSMHFDLRVENVPRRDRSLLFREKSVVLPSSIYASLNSGERFMMPLCMPVSLTHDSLLPLIA